MPEPRWHQLNICRTADPANGATMILVSESDVTECKLAEQRMLRLAHHDPLTGLLNRILLQDRLERALIQINHSKQHVAVLFIDLDRFKPINDSLGHQVGDQLLKAVANRWSGCVREGDTVAWVGGDEFVIVLPHLDDRLKADLVAQKLYLTLAHPFIIDGHELRISASIGISIYPEHGTDAWTLMKHADVAMYEAKQAARSRCHLHFAAST